MTASPSQLTPRTRILVGETVDRISNSGFDFGLWTLDFGLIRPRLPSPMDPKPIRWIAPDPGFQSPIDVGHDFLRRTALTVAVRRDFVTNLDAPLRQAGAIADGGEKR